MNTTYYKLLSFLLFLLISSQLKAENGYRLWLRYDLIPNETVLNNYQNQISGIWKTEDSPTLSIAADELQRGLSGLLGKDLSNSTSDIAQRGTIILGTINAKTIQDLNLQQQVSALGKEGYVIKTLQVNGQPSTIITANTDIGVLYGAFHFLRLLQTQQKIDTLNISSQPKSNVRLLNHWDNLDRTVERGYAGFSLWEWHKLPDYLNPRYIDYARANASIGINGTVLTNVNANALVLSPAYIQKVKALADLFRPYGIKVYLTARFSSPIEMGGLSTADPLDQQVQQWWNDKVNEIYQEIPDFGGFLVKANSEGQPGPQNYGRTHADGANMLADALQPHGGIVMWRAFVYDNEVPDDRAKQAYQEFKPLDGKFRENVMVQVKNGAIDFQPREPFHPLFGAMPATPLMMEFQITQEYLGFATHLVYLAPLFEECLDADTYAQGKGSTVARIIDGNLNHHQLSGMAGVANIGTDRNWTGHPFGQANWYSFGRLAWNPEASSEDIAEEWIGMTFSNEKPVKDSIKSIMMASREAAVNYMTPLGLHHLMGWSHHYGPGPWVSDKPRADWTAVYYHQADSLGIGFNRTQSGSDALSQYAPEVAQQFSDPATCPDPYLLWFHHLPWTFKMKSGNNLWESLCEHYYQGASTVGQMVHTWKSLKGKIDQEQFEHVSALLDIQQKEAIWWRNACVLYFQTFADQPIPEGLEKPDHTLEYYEQLSFPYAPGN